MEIKEVSDEKRWNSFVLENGGGFLQSWEWGGFKSHFQKVLRLAGFEKGKPVVGCQFFTEKLPFGTYLYGPYGPLGDSEKVKIFLEEVEERSTKKSFLRIEPLKDLSVGSSAFSRYQPKKTLIKELTDPESLLAGFDKDTRYSVRRAKREGVRVRTSAKVGDFYSLLKSASKRHDFNIYSKEYFERLIKVNIARLFVATHDDEVAAAAFVSFFGNRATYLHAGMSYEKRKICAPALLNYEIMNSAFEKGIKDYDFWGIDEEEMPGVTKFKKGFGGRSVSYPEGRDVPINKLKYQAYFLAAKILK